MDIQCQTNKSIIVFGTNIYLHIVILFTILAGLFMFVITKIETKELMNELKNMINNPIIKNLNKLKPNEKEMIESVLNDININRIGELYNNESNERKLNNEGIFKSLKIIIILLITALIFVIVINKLLCNKLPLKHMFTENIVIFTGVGIVEFLFFKHIILKYVPVEPSYIQRYFLETVKKSL